MKKLLAIILGFSMLVCLCACGRAQTDQDEITDEDEFINSFSYEENALPAPMTVSTSQYSDGQSLYFCGMDIAGNPLLIKTWTDDTTGQAQSLEYKLPEEVDFVHCCSLQERRLIVIAGDRPANSYSGDLRIVTNEQANYSLYILSFTNNGSLIDSTPIEDSLANQGLSIRNMICTDEFYYLLTQSQLIKVDTEGKVINSLPADSGSFNSLTRVNDQIIVCYFDGDKVKLAYLSEDLTLDTFYTFDSWRVQGIGSDPQGRILVNDGEHIYALDTVSGDIEVFFHYQKAGVSVNDYSSIYPYIDRYLLSTFYQDKNIILSPGVLESRAELLLWSDAPYEELLDYVRGFNQQSKEYHLTVVDTSDQSQEQLMAQIAAGSGPDLYHLFDGDKFSDVTPEQIFEDLAPLISEGSILPGLQSCLEQGDKLYLLPVGFSLKTVVTYANPPVDTSQSLVLQEQELIASGSDHTLFTCYRDSSALWSFLSSMYMSAHIDRDEATCDFETPLFVQLLEYCSDTNANFGGQSSEYRPCVYFYDTIPGPLRLVYFQQQYGDEMRLNTEFGSRFILGLRFAMSNTSQNKTGALEFLNYALERSPDDPRMTWPASAQQFNTQLEEYQNTGIWYENENRFVLLTENTMEQLYAMLDNMNGIYGEDADLITIMDQEAEKCFSGMCSPEEAAAAIQSRASIYMAERYG